MKKLLQIQSVIVLLFMLGCTNPSVEDWPCTQNSDCQKGWFCSEDGNGENSKCVKCEGSLEVIVFNDNTGAVKEISKPNTAGMVDYLDYINDNGGIRGCMVNWKYYDTQYSSDVAKELLSNWKKDSNYWDSISTLIGMGTPIVKLFGTEMNQAKKVLISSSFNADYASPDKRSTTISVPQTNDQFESAVNEKTLASDGYPYVFSPGTDYATQARSAVAFANEKHATRMAMFYCNTSAYCYEPVYAAKEYLANTIKNLKLGRDETIPLSLAAEHSTKEDPDGQKYLDNLVYTYFAKEFERKELDETYEMVDWIWFGNTRGSAFMFAKSLSKATDTFAAEGKTLNVKVVANNWAVDEGFQKLVNDNMAECKHCFSQWHVLQPFEMYSHSTPELRDVHNQYREKSKYPRDEPDDSAFDARNVEYVYGYAASYLWRQAVTAVIDNNNNGGLIQASEITGDMIKEQLEGNDFGNLGGLTAESISFTPTDHRPQGRVFVYQFNEKGEFETSTPPKIQLDIRVHTEWLGW